MDFIDAWNGPWPAYALVFGGVDRLFGAWALLRYPNSALSTLQRRYLIAFAGWMLAGRTLIAVTSTAQWNGDPASVVAHPGPAISSCPTCSTTWSTAVKGLAGSR